MDVEKQIYAGVRDTKRKHAQAMVWIPAAEVGSRTMNASAARTKGE
jgi:hypothetical protein